MLLGAAGEGAGVIMVLQEAQERIGQGLFILEGDGKGGFVVDDKIVVFSVGGNDGVADAHGFEELGLPEADRLRLDEDIGFA